MKIFSIHFKIALTIVAFFFFYSCRKDHTIVVSPYNAETKLLFGTKDPLYFDSLMYTTANGTHYMITDLQYFISRVKFHHVNGSWQDVKTNKGLHYVDGRSWFSPFWNLYLDTFFGTVDSISFVFGLDAADNISYRFPDPPLRDMFWPEILGGGYHYMKMNLKWKGDTMQEPLPFMFHIGIGQTYKGDSVVPDSITGYVQNYFTLRFPLKIEFPDTGFTYIVIQMDIGKWFDSENVFNFSDYPNGMMQNQEAMNKACLNGRNAFSVTATHSVLRGGKRIKN
ncbi:MAG: hypothetical protein NTX61_14225 [Bacteroidetes bacterium]|nr:hypothetical protein [Bacteroidota bacterium]